MFWIIVHNIYTNFFRNFFATVLQFYISGPDFLSKSIFNHCGEKKTHFFFNYCPQHFHEFFQDSFCYSPTVLNFRTGLFIQIHSSSLWRSSLNLPFEMIFLIFNSLTSCSMVSKTAFWLSIMLVWLTKTRYRVSFEAVSNCLTRLFPLFWKHKQKCYFVFLKIIRLQPL